MLLEDGDWNNLGTLILTSHDSLKIAQADPAEEEGPKSIAEKLMACPHLIERKEIFKDGFEPFNYDC